MTKLKHAWKRLVAVAAMVGLSALAGCPDDEATTANPPASTSPAAVAPTITTQPANMAATAGQSATVTVVAAGTAPLGYQWQRNGSAISGATSASYTTAALTIADSGATYTVVVSNAAGSVTSNPAALSVNPLVVAPTLSAEAHSTSGPDGATLTLTVTPLSGTQPFNYQWKRNGVAIADATSSSYTSPPLVLADSGAAFTVTVSNTAGSATSAPYTVTVTPVSPSFTSVPTSVAVTAGQTATFSGQAVGSAPLTYQWRRNGVAIAGATAVTYTTAATTAADDGALFSLVATNGGGSATSTAARLSVTVTTVAPTIATAPQNATVIVGQPATFTASATGSAPLAYQWLRNGAVIAGSTSASYTTAASTPADTATRFSVRVSNSAGTATSPEAVLTVQPATSGLIGRAWSAGKSLETDDNDVLVHDVAVDDLGRATVVFIKSNGTRNVLYATRGTPGTAGTAPVWTAPMVIDVQAGVAKAPRYSSPGLAPRIGMSPNGNAVAYWPVTVTCTAQDSQPYTPCTNTYAAFFNASTGVWDEPVLVARNLAVGLSDYGFYIAGYLNDAGDFALLYSGFERPSTGSDIPRPAVAWRRSGQTAVQTRIFNDAALNSFDLRLDAAGNMLLAGSASQNATSDLVAYRGSTSTGFGNQMILDARGNTATYQRSAVGTGGQQVVVWTQNNGTKDTVYAATAASATGAFTVQDLNLSGVSSNAYLVVTDAGTAWLNDVGNGRRIQWQSGGWLAAQALPTGFLTYNSCATNRLADMLCIGFDGAWTTYDASRNLMVQSSALATPGVGYVLGLSASFSSYRWNLSVSGIGITSFTAKYDTLPTVAVPAGDGRNVVNLWGAFLK